MDRRAVRHHGGAGGVARWARRGKLLIEIIVNGQTHSVSEGTTIAELLDALSLSKQHLAVEVNLEVVPRRQHAAHKLSEGDRLEIVTLVGGG